MMPPAPLPSVLDAEHSNGNFVRNPRKPQARGRGINRGSTRSEAILMLVRVALRCRGEERGAVGNTCTCREARDGASCDDGARRDDAGREERLMKKDLSTWQAYMNETATTIFFLPKEDTREQATKRTHEQTRRHPPASARPTNQPTSSQPASHPPPHPPTATPARPRPGPCEILSVRPT